LSFSSQRSYFEQEASHPVNKPLLARTVGKSYVQPMSEIADGQQGNWFAQAVRPLRRVLPRGLRRLLPRRFRRDPVVPVVRLSGIIGISSRSPSIRRADRRYNRT
jgi:hypothetical protein